MEKSKNLDICIDCEVDSWKEIITKNEYGDEVLIDRFIGKEKMKNVHKKKYLGDLITDDMNNYENINEKTNEAVGIVNKISTTLIERPYGKHNFKAARLMRESMLLGSMLNNAESWININKTDLNNLEKPDTILQKLILSEKEAQVKYSCIWS